MSIDNGKWRRFVFNYSGLLLLLFFCLALSGEAAGTQFEKNSLTVQSFQIVGLEKGPDGVYIAHESEITLVFNFETMPQQYTLCEDQKFQNCDWKNLPFNGRVVYRLSEGSGVKKIFFRAKHWGNVGPTMTIEVNYQPS